MSTPPTRTTARRARNVLGRFRFIDDFVARFSRLDGFAPIYLVASAFPAKPESRVPCVAREFRFDAEGVSTHVRVYGAPRGAWRRETVRRFEAAGYVVRWRFGDETVVVRGLAGPATWARELVLLRELTEDATLARWPRRAQRNWRGMGPIPRGYRAAIEAARIAGIDWTDLSAGFWRIEPMAVRHSMTPLRLRMSVHAATDLERAGCVVRVDVVDENRKAVALPSASYARIRRVLVDCGYRPPGVSSPRVARSIEMSRSVPSPRDAVRECVEVGRVIAAAAT